MAPYGKRSDTIVHEREPFNAETSRAALAELAVTPVDAFYVRDHGAGARDRPRGLAPPGGRPRGARARLSLADLRRHFPRIELPVTLQCAGNRRAELIAVRDIPGEAPWGPGATGTAAGAECPWPT